MDQRKDLRVKSKTCINATEKRYVCKVKQLREGRWASDICATDDTLWMGLMEVHEVAKILNERNVNRALVMGDTVCVSVRLIHHRHHPRLTITYKSREVWQSVHARNLVADNLSRRKAYQLLPLVVTRRQTLFTKYNKMIYFLTANINTSTCLASSFTYFPYPLQFSSLLFFKIK